MQYGNYYLLKKIDKMVKMFKSYYVVWKLAFSPSQRATTRSFKSYYVVWKLFLVVFEKQTQNEFKSYYVVWKLLFVFILFEFTPRLNRTMQYGNEIDKIFFSSSEQFKSYYVVWKLLSLKFFSHIPFWFKSYYVVWKRSKSSQVFLFALSLNRAMQYGNINKTN